MYQKIFIVAALLLGGCATIRESTPIRDEVLQKGLVITRTLPHKLPGSASPVPDSQYVLIKPDSTVAAIVAIPIPVPFVTGIAVDALHQQEARQYKDRYASIDPYLIAVDRLQGFALLSAKPDALSLLPFVYLLEGSDGKTRLTLVYRIEGKEWLGRYMYSLPTVYSVADMKAPTPAMLEQLRSELVTGADVLRGLMERDARGELKSTGIKLDIGSYYLVAGRMAGFVPAHFFHSTDNELVEEGDDYVIYRARGDVRTKGNAGGLVFGVHYFRKDQLHTFKKVASHK